MTELELMIYLNDKLYDIAKALMNYYDCCHIVGSSCKAGEINPCCLNSQFGKGLCPFFKENKCDFEHCKCKLWICETAVKTTDPKCVETLKLLEQVGKLFGLVRAPFIGQPYTGADKQPK